MAESPSLTPMQAAVELQRLSDKVHSEHEDHKATPATEEMEGRIALLLSAAGRNDLPKLLAIVRSGVSPSAADYDKRTALHLAASEGQFEAVKLLAEMGADINAKDRFGFTALDDAVRYAHDNVAHFLRDLRGEYGQIGKLENDLITASAKGQLEVARQLLRNKVSANCKDYDLRTPLHLAVGEGNAEMVQLLLDHGADPKAEDRFGLSPIGEAQRRALRTGLDPIRDILAKISGEEKKPLLSFFVVFMLLWEVAIIVLFCLFGEYSVYAKGDGQGDVGVYAGFTVKNDTLVGGTYNALADIRFTYALFQDVNVMIFIGFGFLMVFLRKNGYQSLGMTFLCSALACQWYILCAGLFHGLFEEFHKIQIDHIQLIKADFAAGALMITYGVLLGKVSPSQLCVVTFVEMIFFALNEEIGLHMKITDIGGSMVIHMFGAFFGMACSLMTTSKATAVSSDNAAVYHSDLLAMIGTIFLWMFWPSFNGALAVGNAQNRAVVNTFISLTGSCIAAFVASHSLRRQGKFNMVDIQNATLAGGVAMGTCADLLIEPGYAMIIGCIAGFVSVFGYVHVQPFLEEKLGLDDTCGVNNLHGMPSIVGAFAGVIATRLADYGEYGDQLTVSMLARGTRTASEQANQQLAYIFITIGIAVGSGVLTGLIARHPVFDAPEPKESFSDSKYWHVPELEMPYYFDHRGEISRGESSGLHGATKPRESMAALPSAYGSNASALEVRLAKLEHALQASKTQATLHNYPAEVEAKAATERLTSVFEHLIQRIDGVTAVSQINMSRVARSSPPTAGSLFSNPPMPAAAMAATHAAGVLVPAHHVSTRDSTPVDIV